MAERQAGEQSLAEQPNSETGKFDRDTAVWLEDGASGSPEGDSDDGAGRRLRFGAEVAPDWRAGRGPHGGYLAAMLLRALVESVADADARAALADDPLRAGRPSRGPVQITHDDRARRALAEHALGADAPGRAADRARACGLLGPVGRPGDLRRADARRSSRADPSREGVKLIKRGGPEFAHQIVLQPRMQGCRVAASEQPMEIRGWIGLAEPRPIDAPVAGVLQRRADPRALHARVRAGRRADSRSHRPLPRARRPATDVPDPRELCLARTARSSSTTASSSRTE